MSSIAGKVAPVPKGEWDSSTTYEKLNIVTHDDAVYMAKAESTNVEPSSTETTYWMLLEDLNGVTTRLTTAEEDIDTLETTTSTLSSDLDTAEASITTINSTIGSETLETTAQTLTGAVNELLEDTETNATNISGLTSAITDEFDPDVNYVAGDHFIDSNIIYTVDVDCIGITPPNANYYTATTVAELIEDNASEISSLNSNLTNSFLYQGYDLASGSYTSGDTWETVINKLITSILSIMSTNSDNGYNSRVSEIRIGGLRYVNQNAIFNTSSNTAIKFVGIDCYSTGFTIRQILVNFSTGTVTSFYNTATSTTPTVTVTDMLSSSATVTIYAQVDKYLPMT